MGSCAFGLAIGCGGGNELPPSEAPPSAVLFVTQTPFHSTFDMVTATFGNHKGGVNYVPRGGDLMIVYPDGTLRNLTEEADIGTKAGQEIAVREPCVHWDGKRALFSMVQGGTIKNDLAPTYWQVYEVTGLGQGETVQITKVPNQPENYNNVSPAYGTNGRILFTSDRPRNGDEMLHPQLDEYESVEVVTGVWSMDPAKDGGDLHILTHVPSGAFSVKVALDGRVVYVRWDHLQRDQQADADEEGATSYGHFDYVSESSMDHASGRTENFPEKRVEDGIWNRHIFNQFFPWQIHEDGSEEETLNHVGRHEFIGYVEASRDDLSYHGTLPDKPPITNFFHIAESPKEPGTFYGVNAPEFGSHTTGQIVSFKGGIGVNADDMAIHYVTHPDGYGAPMDGEAIPPGIDGRYRTPLPMSDGSLVAVYSADPRAETGIGQGPFGNATYAMRLVKMVAKEGSEYLTAGAPLTQGIEDKVAYFDNGSFQDVSYEGPMWEMDPVEVVARPMPQTRVAEIPDIEKAILEQALANKGGIAALESYLKDNDLALLVSRDVTRRADTQQPYNLEVPGGAKTAEPGAAVDQIAFIQFFQADLLRGYEQHRPGRRPIPREMHDAPDGGTPYAGAYALAEDGSYAALVPAGRAMSWQLLDPSGQPLVRERYWVTFRAGEIRVCTNCHGINKKDVVLGEGAPDNAPEALAPFVGGLF